MGPFTYLPMMFFIFLLIFTRTDGFVQILPGARKRDCHMKQNVARSHDSHVLKSSTVEVVRLRGGAEIKLRHQLQIGGLEADGDLTGLKMWPTTSEPMFTTLKKVILPAMHKEMESDSARPLRILELGSGCGLLGISLASLGEEVILTDPAVSFWHTETESGDVMSTLDHLRENIEINSKVVENRAVAAKLFWGNEEDLDNIENEGPFDLIIGSELLYYVDSFPGLLATIQRLGKGGVPVILGYKTRRLGETKFLEAAEEHFDIKSEKLGRKNEGLLLARCVLKE